MNEDLDIKRLQDIRRCRVNKEQIDRAEEAKFRRNHFSELGLCATCTHMHGEITQYGTKRYWCYAFNHPRCLSPNDPLVECTAFIGQTSMDLPLMLTMATPIEATRRKPIGFIHSMDDEILARYGTEEDSLAGGEDAL